MRDPLKRQRRVKAVRLVGGRNTATIGSAGGGAGAGKAKFGDLTLVIPENDVLPMLFVKRDSRAAHRLARAE